MARKKAWTKVDWLEASDIKKRVDKLVNKLELSWIKKDRIFCMRSSTSTSRAHARIWGMSRIWQMALDTKPSYIIEVLSNRFDKLAKSEQDKVLIHELAHIPKNFSGSLMPHVRKKGSRNFNDRVRQLLAKYENNSSTR